jgi:hypothetical protein
MNDVFNSLVKQGRMFGKLPNEMRTSEYDSSGMFVKCEWCGYDCSKVDEEKTIFLANKYRHRYGLILCDRCTDKFNSYSQGRDIDEYWEEEDAAKDNLPPFNYDMPPIDYERIEKHNEFRKKRYQERHGDK